eukprot:maker-scaffold131_size323982-snap-gene-0.17 protein:Tk05543 transcript:maker-scaffold131_size323982-snap-gene-0.17-mRNA-1 annotation:"tnf receptor-associated factor 3 isoform x3"
MVNQYIRESESKMRTWAIGRCLSSPYLTGATILVLTVLSVRHYSSMQENGDLLTRLETLQSQIKTDKFNLQSLENSLTQKNTELDKMNHDKTTFDEQIESRAEELRNKDTQILEAEKAKVAAESQLGELQEQFRQCEESKENAAENLNTSIVEKDQVIQDLKDRVAKLTDSQAGKPANKIAPFVEDRQLDPNLAGKLGDVDPSAVIVKNKALEDNNATMLNETMANIKNSEEGTMNDTTTEAPGKPANTTTPISEDEVPEVEKKDERNAQNEKPVPTADVAEDEDDSKP